MDDIPNFENLSEGNYRPWSLRIKLVLKTHGLWEVVQHPVPDYIVRTEKWSRQNSRALTVIVLRVDDTQVRLIRTCDTAAEAWEILRDAHVNRSTPHRISLLHKLTSSKCGHLRYINDYIEVFEDTVWELDEMGVDIPDEMLVAMILNGLPRSFANFNLLMEGRDDVPTLNSVIRAIRVERDQQVYAMEIRNSRTVPGKCKNCGRRGHPTRYCRKLFHSGYAL